MRRGPTYQAAAAAVTCRPVWFLAGCVVLFAAGVRLALIGAGPDLDTDAYGHAVIGRRLFGPHDFSVHWVWLPLWHWVHAAFARVGSVERLRDVSCALTAALAGLVGWSVRVDHRRPALDAALATTFVAAAPILNEVGSSSQSEATFTLLVFGAVTLWHRERFVWAGLCAALACWTRYEAWAIPLALGGVAAYERKPRALLGLVAPAVAIGLVFFWRRQAGQGLLAFRAENHAFVAEAFAHLGYPWGPAPDVGRMARWYPVSLAWYELRWVCLPAIVGLPLWWRAAPRAHRAVGLSLLAFVSASFVRGDNLGLPRHFAVVAPFYAIAAGIGLGEAAARASAWLAARGRRLSADAIAVVLALALIGPHGWFMHRALFGRERTELRSEREAGRAVRDAAALGARVVCLDPAVEVLSNVPWGRVDRDLAAAGPDTVVAGPRAALEPLRGRYDVRFDDGRFLVLTPRPTSADGEDLLGRQKIVRGKVGPATAVQASWAHPAEISAPAQPRSHPMSPSRLSPYVLRALASAQVDGARIGLEDLATAIGVRRTDIRATLTALDHAGLYDALRGRLTMAGFVAGMRIDETALPALREPPVRIVRAA